MKIVVNSKALLSELRLLDKMISAKPAFGILNNILLETVDNDTLMLSATDLTVGLVTTCSAQVCEPGSITLPSKKLLTIVEQLSNVDMHITVEKNGVLIVAGLFKSRLQPMPVGDFPSMPTVEGVVSRVDAIALKQLISRTRYVIEKDHATTIDGAFLTVGEDSVVMVATNGKTLAMAAAPWDGVKGTMMIIPSKALDTLARFALGTVEVSVGANHLFFVMGHRILFSRMIDAKFPNYQRIIPKNEHVMNVRREVFASVLRRVGMLSEKTSAITLRVSGNVLTVGTSNNELDAAEEPLDVVYAGPDLKLTTSWKALLDFLDAAEGEDVRFELKDSDSHILMKDGDHFLNVVAMMRG